MTQLMKMEQLPVKEEGMIQALATIENAVINGDADPLEVHVNAKRGIKFFEMVAKSVPVMDGALTEALKYKGTKFQAYDAGITETSRSSYDYGSSNDSVLDNLNANLKALSQSIEEEAAEIIKKIKARKEMLKNLTQEIVNPETGEMIQPPKSNTKRTLAVSFK